MAVFDYWHPILRALEQGTVVRKVFRVALIALAVVVLLAGLYVVIQAAKFSLQVPTAEGTIGGLLFTLLLAAAFGAVGQVLLYRAASIDRIPEGSYTVIPVVAVLLRAAGEICATLGAAVAVGGCLFIWLARWDPLSLLGPFAELLPSVSVEGTFGSGMKFLASALLASFAWLILFYFLAESSVVLVDIAANVRRLAGAEAAPVVAEQTHPKLRECPKCGESVEEQSEYCTNCGLRLAT